MTNNLQILVSHNSEENMYRQLFLEHIMESGIVV